MDCKTARLLLDFARPQVRELEAEEAAALDRHLDHCPDCHSQARNEREFDDGLGKAMRQVEVPAGLRDQLLARLESARGDWQRQRFAHAARLSAAAAALLLLGCWGWYWVREHWVAPVDLKRVANAINSEVTEDRLARTERGLKALGADTPLSPYLDYRWLVCPPFKAELPGYPGRMVPSLLFVRNGKVAQVYLISEKAVPKDTLSSIDGSTFKAELLPSQDEPYRFLVIHDGEDLKWLQPPEPHAT